MRNVITSSYNDALAPLFLYMIPLALLAFALLLFVRETQLSTTIERDIPSESLSEGNILISVEEASAAEGTDSETGLMRSGAAR